MRQGARNSAGVFGLTSPRMSGGMNTLLMISRQ